MPDKLVVVDAGGWISGPMDDAATVTPGITNLMHRVVSASTSADVSIVLRGIPANVSTARRFTAAALADCPRADDLVLAVSELASNALAWSASGCSGTFTVRVRTASRWARIEVARTGRR